MVREKRKIKVMGLPVFQVGCWTLERYNVSPRLATFGCL